MSLDVVRGDLSLLSGVHSTRDVCLMLFILQIVGIMLPSVLLADICTSCRTNCCYAVVILITVYSHILALLVI